MAALEVPNGTSLEALFRPSTRLRDSHRNRRGRLLENWTEVELLPGLTVEHVWATGISWEDFQHFLHETSVWMTPHVYVCSQYLYDREYPMVLDIGVDDDSDAVLSVHATWPVTAATAATVICDFTVRLLATSQQGSVHIRGNSTVEAPLVSGAALSLFFNESRSCLRKVTLGSMALTEDLCIALNTMSRLDVELNISCYSLWNGAAGAFVECLQSDRGPVKLYKFQIDSQILASALTGKSRVTKLEPYYRVTNDANMDALFRALANNRGLVELNLAYKSISDENWTILCESLKAHPTLSSLDLRNTWPRSPANVPIGLLDEQKAHRTRLLAATIQRNTVLHTIHLFKYERDEQIYTESILPLLGMNLYRPRVLAIKKVDISLRRSLLGLALQTESVRNDSNLLWMFLSENEDVMAQSNEDSE
jgi:hypothetical protein